MADLSRGPCLPDQIQGPAWRDNLLVVVVTADAVELVQVYGLETQTFQAERQMLYSLWCIPGLGLCGQDEALPAARNRFPDAFLAGRVAIGSVDSNPRPSACKAAVLAN